MCRLRTSASCGGGIPRPHEHETEPHISQVTTDDLLVRNDGCHPVHGDGWESYGCHLVHRVLARDGVGWTLSLLRRASEWDLLFTRAGGSPGGGWGAPGHRRNSGAVSVGRRAVKVRGRHGTHRATAWPERPCLPLARHRPVISRCRVRVPSAGEPDLGRRSNAITLWLSGHQASRQAPHSATDVMGLAIVHSGARVPAVMPSRRSPPRRGRCASGRSQAGYHCRCPDRRSSRRTAPGGIGDGESAGTGVHRGS